MKILLTNDDGYKAQGINLLLESLSVKHEVYMIAPSSERSACSNAITMRDPIFVENVSDNIFTVSGFPADCVNIGIFSDFIPRPDLVVSGINHGPNMGDDVYYSGTVAGARTGLINGISGIAISLCGRPEKEYLTECATFSAEFISEYSSFLLEHPILLNINYPDPSVTYCKGIRFTSLDKRHYIDHYDILENSASGRTIKLGGSISSEKKSGTDVDLTSQGFVSVTPLLLDSTDYSTVDRMNVLLDKKPMAAVQWMKI